MQRSAPMSSSGCGRLASQRHSRLGGGPARPPRAQATGKWKGLLDEFDPSLLVDGALPADGVSPGLEAARQSAEQAFQKTTYVYYEAPEVAKEEDVVAQLRRKLDAVGRELSAVTEAEYERGLANLPLSPRRQAPLGSFNNVVMHTASAPAPAVMLEPLPRFTPATPGRDGNLAGKAEGNGREILLQGFNWESWKHNWFNHMAGQAQEISDMGFTTVWLPPFTDSVSEQGYMPRDLYNLNSRYGSEEQLIRCVKSLQERGIKVLGDAVLNHRCAQSQGKGGIWNQFGGKMSWDERAIVGDQREYGGRGNLSSGESFGAAPNIDHSQPFVKRDLCEWMCWLRGHVGFDGWRLDFVKGFHGSHVKEYLESSVPDFVVGEYWDSLAYGLDGTPQHNQDEHRQRIINWIHAAGGLATAFDITTKGIMHAVFERCEYWRLKDVEGKPPGLMGWWPSRAVTFLENHDTGSTQGHWRFPGHALEQGYVYILTHPGTPTVFYDHLYDKNNSQLRHVITRLIQIRQRNGLSCRSEVKILRAERDVYAAEIDGKLVMKIGPGDFVPEEAYGPGASASQFTAVDCGHCWGIWEKTS